MAAWPQIPATTEERLRVRCSAHKGQRSGNAEDPSRPLAVLGKAHLRVQRRYSNQHGHGITAESPAHDLPRGRGRRQRPVATSQFLDVPQQDAARVRARDRCIGKGHGEPRKIRKLDGACVSQKAEQGDVDRHAHKLQRELATAGSDANCAETPRSGPTVRRWLHR